MDSSKNDKTTSNIAGGTSSTASGKNDQKTEVTAIDEEEKQLAQYLALYKAATSGDWRAAKRILDENPESFTAPLVPSGITVLHLAASSSSPNNILFLDQLLNLMVQKGISLQTTNQDDRNALHYAARSGDGNAVMLLVKKDPTLVKQLTKSTKDSPLLIAAQYGNREAVICLMDVTRLQEPTLLAGESGVGILNAIIMDGFYDLAIKLIEENPGLAVGENKKKYTALDILARKPHAFPSGRRLTFLEHFLYNVWQKFFLVKNGNVLQKEDIENPMIAPRLENSAWKNFPLYGLFKELYTEKLKQKQVLQLLRSLVEQAAKSKRANVVLGTSARMAAKAGIHEFVAEVIKGYPNVIFTTDGSIRNVFDIAVIHRQEKVFNLLYQLDTWKNFTMKFNKDSNSMLHFAAKLEPFARIDKIPGAALQMQRELQWFKAVEQIVEPWYIAANNTDQKVPEMLFFESHKELVKEGETWMKDTANSYTIVAALVVTVAFAAAFTLPGGNNGDNGLPIFLNDTWFMVFAIANTLAMFTSATSLLMFLGILTSRYSQEDFRKALPMRLAIGQLALFFAIMSMLVAFVAATNIFLSHRVGWIIVPLGLLACLPLTLFVFLQFPLLVDVLYSTFGPSIFCKHSDEMLM